MWAQRLIGPRKFEWVSIPQPSADSLREGDVLIKLGAAGICGSDLPLFLGYAAVDGSTDGMPIHEIVGEVVASKSAGFKPGQRVVGLHEGRAGLQEFVTNGERFLHVMNNELDDVRATVIQPVATVLNGLARLPKIEGKRAAVIGLGPIGMIFTHALKSFGAKTVVGIDMVDRSDLASRYGIDQLVTTTSRLWQKTLKDGDRPEIVVEAVGHQQLTIFDAVDAIAPKGHLLAFGIPKDEVYAFAYLKFFRKDGTLHVGITREWSHFLAEAEKYVLANRQLFSDYVTNVFPVKAAEDAFNLSIRPSPGRLKVVMTASSSTL